MPSVLPRIVASMARQAVEGFDLGTELGHPGESGRAREAVIREFLTDVVPPDFGVDTGFVIDATGGISRQVDIVVYRKERAPVLRIGGVAHFMVESVAAAIECKASATSKAVLVDALDNVATVKRLDRTNEGRNLIPGYGAVDPNDARCQVFGAIIAGKSLRYLSCMEVMVEWMEHEPRTVWPNHYVDLHEFRMHYGTDIDSVPTTSTSDPMKAQALVGSGPTPFPWGTYTPLAQFAVELLNFLRATPLIDFHPYGYFTRFNNPMPKWFDFPEGFGIPSADDGP